MAKKILSMALAVMMLASFICLSANAATAVANATFNDGSWPSNMSRTGGFLNTISGGIYGKDAADRSPQAQAEFDAYQDRFFSVNDSITIPTDGKLKISFDIAGESLTNDSSNNYRHYVSMKLNNAGWKFLLQSNNVSCDTSIAINSHLKSNAWNNITYIFDFNSDNSKSAFTIYINGKSVYTNSEFNPWAEKGFAKWTSINGMRFGGFMLRNKLYYDNVVIETYAADEALPSAAFDLALTEDYANVVVDKTAKTVTIDNPDMTVGEFEAEAPQFTFVDENGVAADNSLAVTDAGVMLYAKYTNGINMYYEPYTVIAERNYAIKHETFTGGSFSVRKDGSNGKVYDSATLDWTGMSKIQGVSIAEGKGLGGKAADDSSLLFDINNAASDSDPFAYIAESYVSSSKATKTHTFEAVLYKDEMDAADLQSGAIDLLFGNKVVFTFYANGSVKTANGSKSTNVTWNNGTWLPIAVTYDMAENSIILYAGGAKLSEEWVGAAPSSGDIRLRAFIKSGATFKLAIDDVKFYAGKLEMIKYEIDAENATVTADATENLPCIPFIAEYDGNETLVGVTFENAKRTIIREYEEGNAVKIFLFESLKKLIPITDAYSVE